MNLLLKFIASSNNNIQMVEALLNRNANIEAKDNTGKTALIWGEVIKIHITYNFYNLLLKLL